jgi:2-polyprenyl-3-methyl-5-hydroxy-6-metoxy-1,4-benzoquinol methylase
MNITEFSSDEYWKLRHKSLLQNPKNVGNKGLTVKQNEDLIGSKAAFVAHLIGKHLKDNISILDAGCGAGEFSKYFFCNKYQYSGFDVSPDAIQQASNVSKGNFFVSSITDLKLKQKFDLVMCLDVLFHIVDDYMWNKAVENLAQRVKLNGCLFIIEYFPGTPSTALHTKWRKTSDYEKKLSDFKLVENITFQYPHEKLNKTFLCFKPKNKKQNWFKNFLR